MKLHSMFKPIAIGLGFSYGNGGWRSFHHSWQITKVSFFFLFLHFDERKNVLWIFNEDKRPGAGKKKKEQEKENERARTRHREFAREREKAISNEMTDVLSRRTDGRDDRQVVLS